jgi:hypothetical protein
MPNIYTPPNSISLDKAMPAQMRLGLQGFPGSGKTFAALTFPNPIVINIDRGLGAHIGRSDVIELPFYDTNYTKFLYPSEPENIKEAVMAWLNKEAGKLTNEQTLVFDGLTGIESAYHSDWKKHPVISTRSGKVDDFSEWGLKIHYFNELTDKFCSLKCNVVFISHESEKKDKSGDYTGKIRPLMLGQFADKLIGKYTDWFRQLAADKPNFNTISPQQIESIKTNWNMSLDEFKAMCNTFPRNTIYYWQTESSDIFDGKCSSLVNFPRFIPANYQSFIKYTRKTSTK